MIDRSHLGRDLKGRTAISVTRHLEAIAKESDGTVTMTSSRKGFQKIRSPSNQPEEVASAQYVEVITSNET